MPGGRADSWSGAAITWAPPRLIMMRSLIVDGIEKRLVGPITSVSAVTVVSVLVVVPVVVVLVAAVSAAVVWVVMLGLSVSGRG